MTLFGVEHVLPRDQETDALAGTALREQANQAVAALPAAVGEDPQTCTAGSSSS